MSQNKFFPLPADYGSLTKAGQREARIAVIRDHSTPEALVNSWVLFRNLYLRPREDAFYAGGFKPSPPFHYEMIKDLGKHARNAQAAPRGFGKSVVIGIEVPLLLSIARPYYSIALSMSTDKLIEGRFDRLSIELTENRWIREDFGVLRPKRGGAIWNKHHMHLTNGSVIEGFSIMGRKRGARPQLFIMDDPEFDSDITGGSAGSQYIITEKYEQILFRQIIPMLVKGSGLFWVGTMINRRCLLYRACEEDDPRFKNWMRRVYAAENSDRTKSLWEAAWPKDFLKAREAEMGTSAYSTEYLNRPLTDETKLFSVDPEFNEYNIPEYREMPPEETKLMLHSRREATWSERVRLRGPDNSLNFETESKKEQVRDIFSQMYRVAIVDPASGLTGKHDYRGVGILGYDHNNCLWILDMWLGRVKDSKFYPILYNMAKAWQVRVIGIESFGQQGSLVDSFGEYVDDFTSKLTASAEGTPSGWVPRVVPIKPPQRLDKGSRIAELEWRFQSGKIKYPAHRASEWPISALYEQTENFTRDLALLRFDDAIDIIGLSNYLIHTKGRAGAKAPIKKTLLERIKTNEPVVPGIPLLSGVNVNDLTQEEIKQLVANKAEAGYNRGRFRTRPQPVIVAG
jgi:hypothetical protein